MKIKILVTLIFISLNYYLQAQTYLMNAASNNTNVTTCSGTLYDDGGGAGNYTPSQTYVITLTPATPGTSIQLTFTQWTVDNSTVMELFDGPSVASPSLGQFFNPVTPVGVPVMATAANPTGQLTIRWTAGSTANPGFAAILSCHIPCQPIIAYIDSTACIPNMINGYIDLCFENPQITFSAHGVYPQNGVVYHQSDAGSLFIWDFGDGVLDTGQVVTHSYSYASGFDFSVIIIDSLGCQNNNHEAGRVRYSDNPILSISPIPDMCMGDTVNILTGYSSSSTIVVETVNGGASGELNVADTTYLPDGNGVSYTSVLTYTVFPNGLALTNINDLLGVCMNMEHSYLGDLDLKLTCPNGQFAQLKEYPGGSLCFLGEPIDVDGVIGPCVGYDYCFSNTPTYGTMVAESALHTYSFTDCAGNNYPNHVYLPAGDYTSYQNLSSLLGCPLNGNWTITITDHMASDNGYIFSWGLSLNPALIPGGWSYSVPIDSVTWAGPNITSTSDSTASIVPTIPGSLTYTATVWDSYGCSYDTTFIVQVVQTPIINLGPDTVLCGNNVNYMLDAGPADAWVWSTGNITQTQPVSSTGYYFVQVGNYNAANTMACTSFDTVYIKVLEQPAPVDLGPDICSIVPIQLNAGNIGFQYEWSTSATSQSINVSTTGAYSVTVAEEFGYNCDVTDEINVTIIPEPVISIGPDTALCSFNHMTMTVKDQDGFLDQFPYTYLWSTIPVTALNGQTSRTVDFGCITPGVDYTVSVAVSGCTTVNDERIITAKNCELELYNIITPNGDSHNDKFEVKGLENFPGSNMKIYNRWGKKIFESDNYGEDANNLWDGEKGADGVYYYVLTVNYGESLECVEVINYQGTVTIVR